MNQVKAENKLRVDLSPAVYYPPKKERRISVEQNPAIYSFLLFSPIVQGAGPIPEAVLLPERVRKKNASRFGNGTGVGVTVSGWKFDPTLMKKSLGTRWRIQG